jgi:hypothetical protein
MLLTCWVYTGSFETSKQGEMLQEKCPFIGRLSMGNGSRMSQFNSGWYSIFLLKEKKGVMARGLFSQGRHMLLPMPCWDFPDSAIKGCFGVSLWILCTPNVLAVNILYRSNQNYPSVAPTSQGGFWSHRTQEFWFPTLTTILDLHDTAPSCSQNVTSVLSP